MTNANEQSDRVPLTKPLHDPAKVADAWENWCGETPWSQNLRRFGELGGKIVWWAGYPQSASAIPLVFTLYAYGQRLSGSSRLKDIRAAVAFLERTTT